MDESTGDLPPKIVPLNSYDSALHLQWLVCRLMLVFDTPLDPEKLRSGLCTLAEKAGWEKIGARLKRQSNGQLEYHIPSKFTPVQPAILFSQEQHDLDIKDHPVAQHIPEPTEHPSVVADVESFSALFHKRNVPKTLSGYIDADIPQVALHVVVFRDATTLTISWPHTFADGMGIMEMLCAWTLVLQDPKMKVPQPEGVDCDPLLNLGRNPTQPYRWLDRKLSKWQGFKYACRSIARYLLHPRVSRVVCIPSSFMDSLKDEALRDLSNAHNGKPPFVSEGDVLVAWWARLVFSHNIRNMGKTLNLMSAASLRGPLSKDFLLPDGIYLSNIIGFLQTVLTKRDLLKEPIGCTAYRIRQTIHGDNTREQIEALQALIAKSGTGSPILLGNSAMEVFLTTNWRKMNIYDLDFSSATKDDPLSSRRPITTPYCAQPFLEGTLCQIFTPFCVLHGRDPAGNYWICGSLRRSVWNHIEATLSRAGRTPI